ncbi:S1 RNA-binding domain-containing protein [Paenibacillus yanchengensis]|uniref:S1 RNA-binding domain-containing protein n=1 Tax=Paenibacillus yanchengensis TaxID=2035833 RepID=A0ABW4YKW3_9BACL
MNIIAGTTMTLTVDREVSPYGYFLTDGSNDVLLPYPELVGSKPKINDEVTVFIFHDSEDRITATMNQPLMQLHELARLVVVDVHSSLGCFLEMGLSRHLLLPLSELPEDIAYRPIPGDEVYVFMQHDKSGRLIAKLAIEPDLAPLVFPAPESWHNNWVEGFVSKTIQMGSFVIVDGGVVGFGVYGLIPDSERIRDLRLGERVRARITFVREDGRVNLSMSERKEVGRVQDAERLLAFLNERPARRMPYSDQSDADIIRSRFGMSKAAFKRALGKLMRDGLVTQEGNWTIAVEEQSVSNDGNND